MMKEAKISEDGLYRYTLTREWEEGKGRTVWVMLNPSTADATIDDPTIRRCISFSKAWGRKSMVVVNLFAYRATDPRALRTVNDPFGPENDQVICDVLNDPDVEEVIAAWGNNGSLHQRDRAVYSLVRNSANWDFYCLGTTKSNAPRHPLYLPKAAERRVWQTN